MLEKFDEIVRQSLQSICSMKMEEKVWEQAVQRRGGLDVRKLSDLAKSVFFSSFAN